MQNKKNRRENYDVEEVATIVNDDTQQTRERSENNEGLTSFCGPCKVEIWLPSEDRKRFEGHI